MTILYVIGFIILLVLAYLWLSYNSLVTLRERIREALSSIDVQLKRRNDLIPNLVETVKGYTKHEKEVLENVTRARTSLMSAKTLEQKAAADNQISETLKTLFAVSENYPDLKASQNFLDLQQELSDTENKISYARQFYNGNVLAFNTKIKRFPDLLIANRLGFTEQPFFAANEEEKKNVKVQF